MRVSNAPQTSPAWHKLRLGKFTASQVYRLIGRDSNKLTKGAISYVMEKVRETVYQQEKDTPTNDAMIWGTEHEALAAKEYQIKYNVFARTIGFVYSDHYGASPDRLIGELGGIEIKCPLTKHLDNCLIKSSEQLLKHQKAYFWQCYMNMLCTGRLWWDFVSFDPRLTNHLRLHIVRVERKDIHMAKLVQALKLAIEAKKNILRELGITAPETAKTKEICTAT